jgi:hypothetical protein
VPPIVEELVAFKRAVQYDLEFRAACDAPPEGRGLPPPNTCDEMQTAVKELVDLERRVAAAQRERQQQQQ